MPAAGRAADVSGAGCAAISGRRPCPAWSACLIETSTGSSANSGSRGGSGLRIEFPLLTGYGSAVAKATALPDTHLVPGSRCSVPRETQSAWTPARPSSGRQGRGDRPRPFPLAAGRMDARRREAARPGDDCFLRDYGLDAVAHVTRDLVGAGVDEDLRDAVGERETERDIGLAGHVGDPLDRDPRYVGEQQEPVARRSVGRVDVAGDHVGYLFDGVAVARHVGA